MQLAGRLGVGCYFVAISGRDLDGIVAGSGEWRVIHHRESGCRMDAKSARHTGVSGTTYLHREARL